MVSDESLQNNINNITFIFSGSSKKLVAQWHWLCNQQSDLNSKAAGKVLLNKILN